MPSVVVAMRVATRRAFVVMKSASQVCLLPSATPTNEDDYDQAQYCQKWNEDQKAEQ